MGFERIGLGGVLEFNSRNAVAGMQRTSRAFGSLQSRAGKMGRAAGGATIALSGLGLITAPLALVAKGAAEEYFKFDNAMASLGSVSGSTRVELKAQREEALRLASATKFTATEAAGGLEDLARAGFSQAEQISAIGAVASMAAAENLKLGQSAKIVATTLRTFGLDADKAGMVADTLSHVSANATTDILQLGNAFRYSAGQAASLGMPVDELASTLGILADRGLTGSMAGTALDNMFRTIIKPTEKAGKFLKKFNIQLMDTQGNFIGTSKLVGKLSSAFAHIKDPNDRLKMETEVLGRRGSRAFVRLRAANDSRASGGGGSNVDSLLSDVRENSAGSAARRAKLAMASMIGQITLLNSARSVAVISFLDQFQGMDGSFLAPFVSSIQDFNSAWSALSKDLDESPEDIAKRLGLSKNTVLFAQGVRDGIESIKNGFEALSNAVQSFSSKFSSALGESGARTLGKVVTIMGALTVASVPVIAALLGIAFIVATVVIPAVSALATAVSAAFWPVLVAVGLIAAAYFAMRNENESFMQWAIRTWGAIKVAAMDVYQNVLVPLWQGLMFGASVIWPSVRDSGLEAFSALREAINEFGALWNATFGEFNGDWQIIGALIMVTAALVTNVFLKVLTTSIKTVSGTMRDLRGIIQSLFAGDILLGLGKLAQFIGNALILPIRLAASTIAALLDSIMQIPGIEFLTGGGGLRDAATALRDFGENGVQLDVLKTKKAGDLVSGIGPGAVKDAAIEGGLSILDKVKRAQEFKDAKFELDRENENKRRNEELDIQRESNARGKRKEDKGCETNLHLDGKKVARNQAKHQQDLSDRMGFKTPPFVRRTAAEQGRVGS